MKRKHQYLYFSNVLTACADQYRRTVDNKGEGVRVKPSRQRQIHKLEKYASRSMVGE